MFDVLIIGGGVSGVSCALVLGSAHKKAFVQDKKIGILTHQRTSNLQDALLNNVYGVPAGKLGSELLQESIEQLSTTYPHIEQIAGEKVTKVLKDSDYYQVYTNDNIYETKIVVVAVGASNTFDIEGLKHYVTPHLKSIPEKNRIQLKNEDHKVADNLYVAGVLAGHRSQVAIASGSGAAVATDILTLWNNGTQSHSHDSIRK
jgi:anaerobic glycerol-3-phosphate dehydrogenase